MDLVECLRSSMDRIRVSEALDTGSIPVGGTIAYLVVISGYSLSHFCALQLQVVG